MKIPQRRAVSPIIATLLLIAIAVASGVVVYVFTSGLAGSLTKSHVGQVTEQLSLDAYSYTNPSGGALTVYVRNTGTGSVSVVTSSSFYFDGQSTTTVTLGSSCSTGTIAVGVSCSVTFASLPSENPQTSHTVKVITADGGIFSFNVVAGQTG